MKFKIAVFILFFTVSFAFSQTYLSVDVNEPVYQLLEMAEVRGLIHRLSQARPYTKKQVATYLEQIEKQRGSLTSLERTVLDSYMHKYRDLNRERTLVSTLEEGRLHFNNEKENLFPINCGFYFDFVTQAALATEDIHSTNFFSFFVEGDVSEFSSYYVDFSFGINHVDLSAFSPFKYTDIASDGYYIPLSHELVGGDGTSDLAYSFMSNPQMIVSLFDQRLDIGLSRMRRDIGNGYGNLTVSKNARPYTGLDISFLPIDWFHIYWSAGGFGDYFRGIDEGSVDGDTIFQKMFTTQLFEFMPLKWLYISGSTSAVWGKRFEPAYLVPLLPPLFGQIVTGNQDNIGIEVSMAFTLPLGIKLHGTVYFDEFRATDGIFTDPVMPFGVQAGLRWAIPKLPFTLLGFQYTKLEPYLYAHYEQLYYFADDGDLFDISWTNDKENLGYYLPPNSDEFKVRLESMPYKNWRFLGQYQYIRHGHGEPVDGYMPGYISNGSYDQTLDNTKDFLNDGVYEKIHIVTAEAAYEFEDLPFRVALEYSYNYATNFENIEGNTMRKNILGLTLHIFP